jgi:hypothetical protein
VPADRYGLPLLCFVCDRLLTRPGTIGGGAFLALGGYNYISGNAHLERQRAAILASKSMFGMRSRKVGVAGISLGLAYLGIWRLFK